MTHKNKSMWADMSPVRKKFLKVFLPVLLSVTLIPLIVFCVLMAIDEEKYFPLIIIWAVGVLLFGLLSMACFLPRLAREETKSACLDDYGYLFQEPTPLPQDKVVRIEDEEAVYTLTEQGVKVQISSFDGQQTERVFEEVDEDSFFNAWETSDLLLATKTYLRRVYLGLAVIPNEADGGVPIIIPMTKDLFNAIKGFGLEENIDDENWTYLFYNPEDAFRQILKKGRIVTMRNKKTNEIFLDKNGDFLGGE